jgi:hypothetical protein
MPVEIRELVIKATVDSGNASPAAGGSGSGNNASPGEELIKTCVEKVLEILKERNER